MLLVLLFVAHGQEVKEKEKQLGFLHDKGPGADGHMFSVNE